MPCIDDYSFSIDGKASSSDGSLTVSVAIINAEIDSSGSVTLSNSGAGQGAWGMHIIAIRCPESTSHAGAEGDVEKHLVSTGWLPKSLPNGRIIYLLSNSNMPIEVARADAPMVVSRIASILADSDSFFWNVTLGNSESTKTNTTDPVADA